MGTKHTPGPWHVSKGRSVVWVKAGHQDVAGAYMGSYPARCGEQDLANARLIAAAPELLDFAQQIFAAKDTGLLTLDTPADETLANVLSRGRAAILKATGGQS